jgi:squalene-hopene/tetraprenyl-beta-curcumene cyclase
LDLQNRDGGIPTFCRGWGALPFDRSGADLTAHALLAWSAWRNELPEELQARVDRGTALAVLYLQRVQRADGAWVPLWFGNQHAADEENPTYGTVRVLRALAALPENHQPVVREMRRRGGEWLLAAQNEEGGWGGERGTPSSIEETALAVYGLTALEAVPVEALERGVEWLTVHTNGGRSFDPAPIGFYFAKLWYFEKLYAPVLTAAALTAAREQL